MARYFSDHILRRLRNEIPWKPLLTRLNWPHKNRHGQLTFLCPCCQEYHSAVNPRTNLGRCFFCRRNFNPIELVMAARECDFVSAVHYLTPMLPREKKLSTG